MVGIEGAGTNLEQERRHEKEIVLAYQDDLDIRAVSAQLLQVPRRINAAKSSAEDYDSGSFGLRT